MSALLLEAILELFRNRPTLVAELLHNTLGVELPAYVEARTGQAELPQVLPTRRARTALPALSSARVPWMAS